MRRAIIWTNADPIHWRMYAALGGGWVGWGGWVGVGWGVGVGGVGVGGGGGGLGLGGKLSAKAS